MKTQHTIATKEVVFTPDINVTVAFMGGKTFTGELNGLREWAIQEQVNAPASCYVEGKRHGIYACIKATDQRISAGLSILCGARINVGDGATFATRSQMREVARALNLAGIAITKDQCDWGITDQPFAEDWSKPTPTIKPISRQMSLEEQMADSPWG